MKRRVFVNRITPTTYIRNLENAPTHTRIGAACICALLAGACAQAFPPPGGTPDKEPPRIISTVPAQNAVVPDFSGQVRIKFDEALSERGPRKGEEVSVSPETGEVTVDRHGSELRISIKGGWQNGRVYHVAVLPGFLDRHGNARATAYELVFSTGPEILPTALGGLVTDRLTARAVANARVVALGADSVAYATSTDTAGFFALQSLPLGTYFVTAFLDTNRNRKLDGNEPRDTKVAGLSSVRDTPVVEFAVLAPDTLPARLLRADARDSLQVRLTFDDFIEADAPLPSAAVTLFQLPDSTQLPRGELLHLREFDARRRAAAPDTAAKLPRAVPGAVAADTGRALPTQELVYVPARPLASRTRYRISVTAIRNISGLDNGGGSVTFETLAAPRPAAPRDTTAARPKPVKPDSTATKPKPVKPDSTATTPKPDSTAHPIRQR